MNTQSHSTDPADIVPRLFAVAIDMAIIWGMWIGTALLLGKLSSEMYGVMDYTSPLAGAIEVRKNAAALFVLLMFIEMWIYIVPLETSAWQASFGKKICGLKVVNGDGRQMGQLQATWRCFIKFLTFGAPMWVWTTGSLLLIVSNAGHKALHDYISGTRVVENVSGYLFQKDRDAAAKSATHAHKLRTGGYDKY